MKSSTLKSNRRAMHETLSKLYALQGKKFEKYGLENMERLADYFGHPEKCFKSIHIAGTNGKGSTAYKIASALTNAGYKTGLFTSPHISCIRERIQIDGEMISEQQFMELLPDLSATIFELLTITAFRHFAKENVDYAVIETGLGGRLDATNIITPVLSVITSIARDHEHILGSSLKQIAQEKAGIIKPGVPLILGPNTPYLTSPLKIQDRFQTFDKENSAIAQMALTQLNIAPDAIQKGICSRPPCRMEVIAYKGRNVILDVAHNKAAIETLFKSLNPPPDTLLFALSETKDIDGVLDLINRKSQPVWVTEGANPRKMPCTSLAKRLNRNFHAIPDCRLAFEDAIDQTPLGGSLLCFGTFFIMSQIRLSLGIDEPLDPEDLNEKV